MFLDGTQVGSTYTDNNDYGTTKPIKIGADHNGSNALSGYVDEVRVSTNARYTATFTPSIYMFQGDVNTVLLVHFDGANLSTTFRDWSGVPTWNEGDQFLTGDVSFRFFDASEEILNNIDLIAQEAIFQTDSTFPRLHIPHPDDEVAVTYGKDFYNVTIANLDLIAAEAYDRINPTPPPNTGPTDCRDDVKDVIRNIAYNVTYGYNN